MFFTFALQNKHRLQSCLWNCCILFACILFKIISRQYSQVNYHEISFNTIFVKFSDQCLTWFIKQFGHFLSFSMIWCRSALETLTKSKNTMWLLGVWDSNHWAGQCQLLFPSSSSLEAITPKVAVAHLQIPSTEEHGCRWKIRLETY